MKNRICLFLFLFISLKAFGQDGGIEGKVMYKLDSTLIDGVMVLISGTSTGTVTSDGHFQLKDLAPGKYDLVISYIGLGKDSIKNVVVNANATTTLELGLPAGNCSPNSPKICPVDKHTDRIIPIVYGFPGKRMMRKAKKEKIVLGGCELTGCDPKWYCKKHKRKF